MEWLNYHHLFYFWSVARAGSIARASLDLRLASPTISAQLRRLEDALGEKLFAKSGRHLVLTEMGHVVNRYAEEIFSLGRELVDTVRGRATGHPLRLRVGIADVVPKLVAHRLLEPALNLPIPVRVTCHEGKADRLLADLAVHALDVVLSDSPAGPGTRVRVFNHPMGEFPVGFFAGSRLAGKLRRGFPRSLDNAPMLLPTGNTALRKELETWFDSKKVRPQVVGEFEDSALMNAFGRAGRAAFPAAMALAREVRQQYAVESIGRAAEVRERYYVISVERKISNPSVVSMLHAAKLVSRA